MRALLRKIASLSSRCFEKEFLVLNALLVFLLFIFFPGLIFFRGTELLIKQQIIRENTDQQQKIERLLDRMTEYANNDIFVHRLLYQLCDGGSTGRRSLRELPSLIRRVKNLYPESFTFIVANRSGNVINELSDEKKFSYLYKQAFSFIAEYEHDEEAFQKDDTETRLQRLRPLLGEMLRQQDLHLPLLSKKNGRSILVSGTRNKFHLWYGSGSDFRLMVFVSRDFIRSTAGLKWFTSTINDASNDYITGFSPFPPEESALNQFMAPLQTREVMRAIAENEEINYSHAPELAPAKVIVRFLNQPLRGFCLRKNSGRVISENRSFSLMMVMIRALLLLVLVLSVYHKINPISMTIKLKIAAFFAYSLALPFLVIASIGGEVLAQQRGELTEDLNRQVTQLSKTLDNRFSFFLENTAHKLKNFIADDFSHNPEFAKNHNWSRFFNQKISELAKHEEMIVIDADARDHMFGFSGRLTANTTLIRRFTADALRLINWAGLDKVTRGAEAPYQVVFGANSNHGSIGYLGISEIDLYSYNQFLSRAERSLESAYAIYVLWRKSVLQERFISQICQTKGFDRQKIRPVFYNKESKSIIGENLQKENELISFFRQSENRLVNLNMNLTINKREYVAIAVPGQKLDKTLIALLCPAEILQQKIEQNLKIALYIALLMALVASAGAWLLSDWLFKPLDTLKNAMRAIADHNFNLKLEVVCQNEMGTLIKAFNNSFETMQDLEVARVVQESLLSQNSIRKNRLEIAVKSNVMSKLGGDYYDMVQADEERILIFIGDATGHGIPAAISMAMAKAVMIHESLEVIDQQSLMEKFHLLFSRLRSQGVKDFMTATSIMLNSISGEVKLINAGHCYPILLKKGADHGTLLSDINGIPPGFSRSQNFNPVTISIEPGDTLIFFTDGLIECRNQADQALGFEGLQRIVAESWNVDLTAHLEAILAFIRKWETQQEDDQTAILVRFS